MSRIITVTGEIDADSIGRALVHEHIFAALPGAGLDSRLSVDETQVIQDAVAWLRAVKEHGVDLVVDATPIDWFRRPDLLPRISEESEVYIVASTGLYSGNLGWPLHFKTLGAEQLTDVFRTEIERGILDTGVRAGMIKVASGGSELLPLERLAIEAAVAAQRDTGVGIITHTDEDGGHAQLAAFEEVEADLDRVLIGHIDSNPSLEYHLALIERGAQIGFDRIGYSIRLSDEERLAAILAVIEAGRADRILFSHDAIATHIGEHFAPLKTSRWAEYGFTFLFREVLPKLEDAGVPSDVIENILTTNTRRLLAPA